MILVISKRLLRDDGVKMGRNISIYNKAHILRVHEDMGLIMALFHSIEVIRLLLRTHNRENEDCQ